MSSIDNEANTLSHPRRSHQSTEAMSYEKWLKIFPDFTVLHFTDQRLKRKHINCLQQHPNGYHSDGLV